MNESLKPVVGRLRRPTWRDPRLLIGLLLVAVSVVAVSLVIRAADSTTPYYAAKTTLTPGTVLTEADLVVVSAHLTSDSYLVQGIQPWGQVVTRVIEPGELVPRNAVINPEDFGGRPIGVRTAMPLASTIEAGAVVDVFVTALNGVGEPVTTTVGTGLVVDEVVRDQARLGLAGSETVYVVVPVAQITDFLDALAVGGDISVVGFAGRGS